MIATFLLLAPGARADPVSTPIWGVSGAVSAIALSGTTAYIGGTFDSVGPPTGPFAVVDGDTAALQSAFPRQTGVLGSFVADGAGGVYAAASAIQTPAGLHHGLVHIRGDGSIDPNFLPTLGPGGSNAGALLLVGSTLYAGGNFSTVDGQPSPKNLAAFDTATGAVTAWNPDPDGSVQTLASFQGLVANTDTIFAGGSFTHVNGGVVRNHLAGFEPGTGTVRAFDPNLPTAPSALAIFGSTIYAGGQFSTVNGGAIARNNLAAFDVTNGTATAWDPNADGDVESLAAANSHIYAGGGFTHIGATTRNAMAELDRTSGAPTAFDPDLRAAAPAVSRHIAISGTTIYTVGLFDSVNGTGTPRSGVAAFDATSGAAKGWDPRPNGLPTQLGASGSNVFLSGQFHSVDGVARKNLAAIDLTTGEPTAWAPSVGATVRALALRDGVVYVGGEFTTAGPLATARPGLAAFDAATGALTSWNPQPNGVVHALDASTPNIFAGGEFTKIGAIPRAGVAKLDPASGAPDSFNPGIGSGGAGYVNAFAMAGATTYLGGGFLSVAGNTNVPWLAAVQDLPPTAGPLLPGFDPGLIDPGFDQIVDALALVGGVLYAGGQFTTVNHTSAAGRLAALDATTGQALSWDSAVDREVRALTVAGPVLYAGGDFMQVNGVEPRAGLAGFDAATGAVTSWHPLLELSNGFLPRVSAVASDPSAGLVVGGGFDSVGSVPQAGLTAFALPPAAPTAVKAVAGNTTASVDFAAAPSGGAPVTSYRVTASPGGQIADGPAGPLAVSGLDNGTAYTFTATATNAAGTGPASSPSDPVTPSNTVISTSTDASTDTTPPALTALSASHRRFRVARGRTALTGIAARAKRKPTIKRGTTLTFALSEPASLRFTLTRLTVGRLKGKRCAKTTKATRRHRRCTLQRAAGSFTRTAKGGRSRVPFSGRIGSVALRPGRYRLTVSPTDLAGLVGTRRSIVLAILR